MRAPRATGVSATRTPPTQCGIGGTPSAGRRERERAATSRGAARAPCSAASRANHAPRRRSAPAATRISESAAARRGRARKRGGARCARAARRLLGYTHVRTARRSRSARALRHAAFAADPDEGGPGRDTPFRGVGRGAGGSTTLTAAGLPPARRPVNRRPSHAVRVTNRGLEERQVSRAQHSMPQGRRPRDHSYDLNGPCFGEKLSETWTRTATTPDKTERRAQASPSWSFKPWAAGVGAGCVGPGQARGQTQSRLATWPTRDPAFGAEVIDAAQVTACAFQATGILGTC